MIIIGGPTASGKTALSIHISKYLDIEIISADSRQVYKYLDIGTAKPDTEELSAVKHHFIDILRPDEYFSAGVFGKSALETAKEIFNHGKIPVVVGGSGLYIKALIEGFFDDDEENFYKREEIRKELEDKLLIEGKESLYGELYSIDPDSAIKYQDKNPRRVIRALEYIYLTGKKFSETFEKFQDRQINYSYFAIEFNRDELYNRINLRTEKMWENGLIDETKKVLEMGYSKELNSLNTVGYKESIEFLEEKISEQRVIELIQQNTRRYAKRQITWFKKVNDINYLDSTLPYNSMAELIVEKFKHKVKL